MNTMNPLQNLRNWFISKFDACHSVLNLTVILLLLVFSVMLPETNHAQTVNFPGPELLGCPTNSSIIINVVSASDIYELYYEYGTSSGVYSMNTAPTSATANIPHETIITGLSPNTRYYYRMQYRATSGSSWVARDEHSFHTQRAEGSTFKFTIISDTHAEFTDAEYQSALAGVLADQPDFHLDLGDTQMTDYDASQSQVNDAYLTSRSISNMGSFGHSIPIFLTPGNHENEEGWNLDDSPFSPALASIQARKWYFPTPDPNQSPFYTANTDVLPGIDAGTYGDQYREDYYAWEWGDVAFIFFDPFQYTMQNPYGNTAGEGSVGSNDPAGGDRWNWSLGAQQYNWLKATLEQYKEKKYKFMFAHHMLGGEENYVREGATPAHMFEWGGYESDGTTWGWDTRRPGWGPESIRQLMIDNGVCAFFHGHDHQYAYQVRDGIVYQCLPKPSPGLEFSYYSESDPYTERVISNSGYIRVTVTSTEATVEYVRTNATGVSHSYTIAPNPITTGPNIVLSGMPLSGFTSEPGVPSAVQNYTVSGSSLTQDITISAPADFGISLNNGGPFTSSLILTQSGGTVPSTTIYVQFNRSTEGTSTGNISHSSTGATTENAAVTGTASVSSTDAISIDGLASFATADGVSSISISHTTGTGTNRLLMVGVASNSYNSAQTISSVVFTPSGGSSIALALVGSVENEAGRLAAIYSLLNPPMGVSGTVLVTYSGTVNYGIVAGAVNFAGVDPDDPLDNFVSAVGTEASAISLSVPSEINDFVFDVAFLGAATLPTMTVGSNQTQLWNASIDRARGVSSYETATAASTTMSWTASGGATAYYWALGAVAINPAPGPVVPTITLTGTPLNSFTTQPGTPSGEQSYTVTGSNLTDNISITAPADFEISTTSGSGFSPAITLTQSGGSVPSTTIYVRYIRATAGSSNGNITHTSTGATQQDLSVSGTASESGPLSLDGPVSSGIGDANASSLTFAHTTGTGNNRFLLVGVSWNCGSTDRTISSITFTPSGGSAVPLSLVFSQETTGTADRHSAIYSYLNPPVGQTGNVSITFSGTVSNGIVAGAANFSGVNQADPLGTPGGASGQGTASSVTLTGLTGNELVFDNLFQGASDESQTLTPGANQTALWNQWISNTRGSSSTESATGSSVTMSWTATESSYWAIAAVPINPLPNQAPNQPLLVQPGNNSTDISTEPTLEVAISDPEEDGMTVSFYGREVTSYAIETPASVVTVDGSPSSNSGDDVSTLNITHTTGTGSNRLMLVGVSWNCNTTDQTISSVTFTPSGGSAVALTHVITQETSGTTDRYSAIYSLLNPASGVSGTITITFTGSVSSGIVAGAINFANVDQVNPTGPTAGNSGNDTAPNLVLNGLDGDEFVFDNVFQGASNADQTLTPGTGQTTQWTAFAGNTRAASSIEQADGSSVTMNWTAATSSFWAIAAVAINPAPASNDPLIVIGGLPLQAFISTPGSPSSAQNYLVSGYNLSADITVTAPADFEVSTSYSSGYTSSATLYHSGGQVAQTPIYVRFTRASAGTSTGNITQISSGATQQNVAVSGTAATPGITIDGAVSNNTADGTSSISISHTTGTGQNRLLLVGVSAYDNGVSPSISSVTFTPSGGSAISLSQIGTQVSSYRQSAIYGIVNPPSDQSGSIAVTFSQSIDYGIIAGAINLAGVDQTNPWGTAVTNNGTNTSPTVSVTGLSGNELIFDVMCAGRGSTGTPPTATVGSGQTQGWNSSRDRTRGASSTEQATGSSVTMSWSLSTFSGTWVTVAVPIRPASSSTYPEITLTGTPLSEFTSEPGFPSAGQSYSVAGSNLTVNILITAPADFEISTSSGSGFGPSVTLVQSGGSVAATPIYVRFNRATPGASAGAITHTSTGAYTRYATVRGSTAASFALIGTTSASSGSSTSVPWNGLDPDTEYEWYALSSDGISAVASTIWAFTTGQVSPGFALDLDGTDDYVDCGNASSLNISSALTLEAWIRPDASGAMSVIRKNGNSAGYELFIGADGHAYMRLNENAGYMVASSSVIPTDGSWSHIAGVYNGASMTLYVNGVPENTVAGPPSIAANTRSLVIGTDATDLAGSSDFNGQIDEVRIWNTARTQSQIQQDMHRELVNPAGLAGLAAYYRFNKNAGTKVTDVGPNRNTGTLVNGPSWVSSTAPIPYYSVASGNWDADASWESGQQAPDHAWARTQIGHDLVLNSPAEAIDVNILATGSLTMNPGQSLTVSGTLTNASGVDGLVVLSDETGTGSLIEHSGVAATVKRYIPAQGWHYIAAPVSPVTASVFLGHYLMNWDEPSQAWSYIINPSTLLNTNMKGYGVWMTNNTPLSFTGTTNAGSKSIPLTKSSADIQYGYNLVGNPYPSALDWDASGWTRSHVDNAIYFVYYTKNGNAWVANWASYVNGSGNNGGSNIIPPHQGFMVKCNNEAGGVLGVNDDARVHANNAFFKAVMGPERILRITAHKQDLSDEMVIVQNAEASFEFDSQFDAYKLYGGSAIPQVYSYSAEGRELSINAVSEIDAKTTIPLGISVGATGIYQLKIKQIEGFDGLAVYLEDLKEQTIFNFKDNLAYKFVASPDDDEQRFILRFSINDEEPPVAINPFKDILIYPVEQTVVIESREAITGIIRIFDLYGREITARNAFGETHIELNTEGTLGCYIVTVQSDSGVLNKKVFLRR